MPQSSLFRGLAIVALSASAAVAQSRVYRTSAAAASGAATQDNSGRAQTTGSSNQAGMVVNAGTRGGSVTPGQPAATPTANAQPTARSNASRPTFIAIDPERERLEREREFHRRHRDAFLPAYPVYTNPPDDTEYYTNYTSFTGQQPQPTEQVAEPEAPAPTIFENRPGYQPPPIRAYQPSSPASGETAASHSSDVSTMTESGQTTSAVAPQITTILVFRDGHQLEIGNYAIVGDTLYNLAGTNESHKILLADLDLDKTIKVNQARGYDFRLPKRPS